MRLFSIPAGAPFLADLANGLIAQAGAALPDAMVLLPTCGAAEVLAGIFARLGVQSPPAIRAIGAPEDEVSVSAPDDALPPLLPPLRRRLLLARLIGQWSLRGASDPMTAGQAARLADSLVRLIDRLQSEELDLAALQGVPADRFAAHHRVTLDFLDVLREHWPRILAEEAAVEPVERHNLMLRRLARSWREAPPTGPVIAAGFVEAGAALRDLLATVATLERGGVVLPGLDRDLAEPVWQGLGPTHPQYGLRRLLLRLGAERDRVLPWPASADSPPGPRLRLIAEAMRPAETTEEWAAAMRELSATAEAAIAGLSRIEAPNPRGEAAAIALMLRAVLERPDGTAALVTADAALARRVGAELRRWGIAAGGGAGPSQAALFLQLLARAAAAQFAPVPLLSLLKHPLSRAGLHPEAFRAFVSGLERAVLRGPRPAPGLDGLMRALALAGADKALIRRFLDLADGLRPFAELMAGPAVPPRDLVAAHRRAAAALATDAPSPQGGPGPAALLDEFAAAADCLDDLDGPSYAELLDTLVPGWTAPPPPHHPRLALWTLAEAQMRHADLVVVAGLNEGTWPEPARADPWLNRPMLAELGLPLPEEAIGRTAHLFAQLACAPRVVLSRARKTGGAPAIPSRWLVRLEILARGLGIATRLDPAEPWLGWAEALDMAAESAPCPPPRPAPPVAARPIRLSTGDIATLLRDPYSIYARHVLRLVPLHPIDADPGAAERGRLIHRALDAFLREHPERLPADALDRLTDAGRALFEDDAVPPAVAAFWWPRFQRLARWFVECFEPECRARGIPVALEQSGAWTFPLPGGRQFTLTGRTERIDRRADGTLAVFDYTTGRAPALDETRREFSPKLALQGLIARAGGFPGVPAGEIGGLAHVVLSGAEPPGELAAFPDAPADLLARTEAGLKRLLARFEDPKTPYPSNPRPELARRPGPYDHLARLGEWGLAGEAES